MAFSSLPGGAFLHPPGQRNNVIREGQVDPDAAPPDQLESFSHGRTRSGWRGTKMHSLRVTVQDWRAMGVPGH